MAEKVPTKKHRDFVKEPIRGKGVIELPGIGKTAAESMQAKDILWAEEVVGRFLVLKRNDDNFKEWIKSFGTDRGQQNQCLQAIRAYCEVHL